MRCLILNQDNQLLHISNWKRAIQLVLNEKIRVISKYERKIHTEKIDYEIPAVAMLNRYVVTKSKEHIFNRPSKKILLIRDKFSCQYCGVKLSYNTATIDHVIPREKGGKDHILNCVSSCKKCNNLKDNMFLDEFEKKTGIYLRNEPRHLTEEEKIMCVLKSFRSKEKKIWMKTLKENKIVLW